MPKTIRAQYQVAQGAEALAHAAAEFTTASIARSIAARGVARMAISGGHTPRRSFAMMADPALPFRSRIDWSRLLLFWVDERCVPPDNAESNYGMTREDMLSKVPLPPSQIFRMEGELDPEQAASRYESTLRNVFRLEGAEVPCFDLLALGMGEDGHTASLFPHTAALHEQARLVVANHVAQKNTWRITLTTPVINHARKVFFMIEGADKARILHDVLLGPYQPEMLPSQLVCPTSGELLLLLDVESASELPAPDAQGAGTIEVTR
jgi:6-phosphogluconolactonase